MDFLEANNKELHCLIEETHHAQKIDSPSGTAIEVKKIIELNNVLSISDKKRIEEELEVAILKRNIKNKENLIIII